MWQVKSIAARLCEPAIHTFNPYLVKYLCNDAAGFAPELPSGIWKSHWDNYPPNLDQLKFDGAVKNTH